MSTTIKPTVGRVVWFYPAANTAHADFSSPAAGEPLAAVVAAVKPGYEGFDVVNLTVFDAAGRSHPTTLVPLLQDGQDVPADGFYATWMPYQVDQAKKAADREHDAKQLAVAADCDADARRLRAGILDLALRTPGLANHSEVLEAAQAYQKHIEGWLAAEKTMQQRPPLGAAHAGYSTMAPHQQRVVDEWAELDAKLAKLIPFFDTPTFAALDEGEKSRLERQEEAMKVYSEILAERIAAFAAAASTTV